MPRIELVPEVIDDFDRFLDHQAQFGVEDTADRIADIMDGIQILARNPLIGRKASGGKRELVIGQDSRGYVVLYRHVADLDVVFVLAIRSQRELGFKRRP